MMRAAKLDTNVVIMLAVCGRGERPCLRGRDEEGKNVWKNTYVKIKLEGNLMIVSYGCGK